jgi:predicted Fe-Mo cluster-binding NifX family protein
VNEQKTRKHIAIAAEDDRGFDGQVSHHFGRCPFYFLVEVEGDQIMESKVAQNPFYGNHQPGQMPAFIKDLGANVILAGGMGPRAIDLFMNYEIEVATGAIGNVKNVLDAYLRGDIKGIVPCSHDHPESCGGH